MPDHSIVSDNGDVVVCTSFDPISKCRQRCSGPAASAIGVLAAHGLRIREVHGPVGAASALKMSYAGITKGLTAVASAMSLGAARAGVEEVLLAELAESQPQLPGLLRRMVPDMLPKAWRWVAKMEEIAGFLDGAAGGGAMYQAVAELCRHLAADFPDGADVAMLEALFRRDGAPAAPPGKAG